MGKHVFCRDLAIERGEPLAGTGIVPRRGLLLRWPRGKWRAQRFESEGMSPDLTDTLRALAASGAAHVALFDRVGETDTLPGLIDPQAGVAADYADETELIETLDAFGRGVPLAGRPDPRIVILCCTDSRHDACCARFGFATYKALDAIADREKFNVLQSTHLGYCRMAARINVLPSRHSYGRFDPGAAADFLDAVANGQPYLPAYRGRADLPEPLQVAELALLVWADARHHALDSVSIAPVDLPEHPAEGDELLVAGRVAQEQLMVRVTARTYDMHGTCGPIANGEPARQVLRWQLAGIGPTMS